MDESSYPAHSREQDMNCDRLEKPKNEMISRHSKAVVVGSYEAEAVTKKSAIFWLPEGRANYANLLRCFEDCVPQRVRYASRRLEYWRNWLRSSGHSSNPVPLDYPKNNSTFTGTLRNALLSLKTHDSTIVPFTLQVNQPLCCG